MDLFKALAQGSQASQVTSELASRAYGLQLAVVVSTDDPMSQGRVQVALPDKGGRYTSDWLWRLTGWSGSSPQVPNLGDTVVVGFLNGDKHQGVYLGVLQNLVNPATSNDTWTFSIGSTTLTIDSDGVTIDSPKVTLTSQTSVSIEGKEVATLGAKDTRNDTLVTRGW